MYHHHHQKSPAKSSNNSSPLHCIDQKLEGSKAGQTCWIKFKPLKLFARKFKKHKDDDDNKSGCSNSSEQRGGSRMQSLNSSPAHPSLYHCGNNMGRQEMDESIHSAIVYCKKTMSDQAKRV